MAFSSRTQELAGASVVYMRLSSSAWVLIRGAGAGLGATDDADAAFTTACGRMQRSIAALLCMLQRGHHPAKYHDMDSCVLRGVLSFWGCDQQQHI